MCPKSPRFQGNLTRCIPRLSHSAPALASIFCSSFVLPIFGVPPCVFHPRLCRLPHMWPDKNQLVLCKTSSDLEAGWVVPFYCPAHSWLFLCAIVGELAPTLHVARIFFYSPFYYPIAANVVAHLCIVAFPPLFQFVSPLPTLRQSLVLRSIVDFHVLYYLSGQYFFYP